MCEMKDVVESIAVWLTNVVRKWIANEHAIPSHITLSGFPLHDLDIEM